MNPNRTWSFDLERALSSWRQFMNANPAIRPDDLDELEAHLRDEIDRQMSRGMDAENAFKTARADLGDVAELGEAYDAVHHEKRFRPASRRSEWGIFAGMMRSYFSHAWRGALRHRGYTLLNVLGISIALASALIIGLFIRHSLSYDRHLPAADRTYRVLMHRGMPDESTNQAFTTVGLADLIRSEWSGAERVTEAAGTRSTERLFSVDDVHYQIDQVLSVDGDFPAIFPLTFTSGDGATALTAPGSVILTTSTARRLFGSRDPMGQTIRLEAQSDLTVTGIVEDPPSSTHLPFSVLVRAFTEYRSVSWNSIGSYIFVVLQQDAKPEELASYLTDKYLADSPGAVGSYSLQPVTDIHLHSGATDDYAAQGEAWHLTLFGAIGFLIMALACINYVNMATARATRRVREVGVRKVVGASGSQLKGQFLLESLFITLLSVPLAILMAVLALPKAGSLAGESLSWTLLLTPGMLGLIVAYVILIAFGAGFYPAVLLARKSAAEVFSGSRSFARTRVSLRQVLVGAQVGMAFCLVVITLVISDQMDLLQQNSLGFDQDQVVTLSPRGWSETELESFVDQIGSHSSIESAASGLPLGIGWRFFSWTEKRTDSESEIQVDGIPVGVGFVETMGMHLVEGRAFNQTDLTADPLPVIVSKDYADALSDGSSIVGSRMKMGNPGEIIGVVSEFQNSSLMNQKNAAVLQLDPSVTWSLVVKLKAGHVQDGISVMEDAWKQRSPDRPMTWRFLDERIQEQYVREARFGSIFEWFSGLSLSLAVFGLVGLSALSARQRDKEIAIRKSLGASESGILLLLNREFLTVVWVGMLLSAPVAWLYGHKWLEGFSRRIEIGVAPFLWAATACLFFVIVSVNVQSFRAARANPIDALKWD